MRARLGAVVSIPLALVPDLQSISKELTVKTQPMGEEEPTIIELMEQDDEFIHVPRQYGLGLCNRLGVGFDDMTSQGHPVTFPKVPTPKDYQVEPIAQIVGTFDSFFDFLFRARTGWGKTVGSLIVAARLGVTTLVIVDQEALKLQWVDSLVNLFGFKREDIGIIQGDVCSYEGKAVTIAMVQTLVRRDYKEDLYRYFGLAIVDEVHTIGAPTFSTILLKIPAAYRLGVSATPKRKDGLQKILNANLGRVKVSVGEQHDESTVIIKSHHTVYSYYANTSPKIGRFITEISEDSSRNLLIAETVVELYESGRDVLVLSDRIEQLRHLMSLCYYLGMEDHSMGLHAGYCPVYRYAKDATPPRKPRGAARNAEYTPVALQLIEKRVKKDEFVRIRKECGVIFATYGTFSKGTDVPRLSAGVDATPRSESEQVQGRILRVEDGKPIPIWATILDNNSYRSTFSLASRFKGYRVNNSSLLVQGEDGKYELWQHDELQRSLYADVARLKSARILERSNGRYTLATSSSQPKSAASSARATRTVRRRAA